MYKYPRIAVLSTVSLVFTFILLAGFVSALGQDGPPPPAPDYNPKSWKEYSFVDDNLRFRFPTPPKREETTSGQEKHPTHVYRRQSFMLFELSVVSFPQGRDLETDKDLLDGFVKGGLARVKDLDPKILAQENVSVDGHPARFTRVETNDGLVIRAKFFAVKNRLYIAYAISKKGDQHGFNWENDFEVPAMGFLDSIHLIQ